MLELHGGQNNVVLELSSYLYIQGDHVNAVLGLSIQGGPNDVRK